MKLDGVLPVRHRQAPLHVLWGGVQCHMIFVRSILVQWPHPSRTPACPSHCQICHRADPRSAFDAQNNLVHMVARVRHSPPSWRVYAQNRRPVVLASHVLFYLMPPHEHTLPSSRISCSMTGVLISNLALHERARQLVAIARPSSANTDSSVSRPCCWVCSSCSSPRAHPCDTATGGLQPVCPLRGWIFTPHLASFLIVVATSRSWDLSVCLQSCSRTPPGTVDTSVPQFRRFPV